MWVECVVDNDFEIFTEYPHALRRKGKDKLVSVSLDDKGYERVHLNNIFCPLHRVIAQQFIPNDDPLNKTQVDHKNHIRNDNRIENLRWVSASGNLMNRLKANGCEYEFIDYEEMPDDIIIVDSYGAHEFENYYYSPETNRFYFDTGVSLKELKICFTEHGSACVYMRDTNNKKVRIYYMRFKKLYGIN